MDGNGAGFSLGAVLEFASLPDAAIIGPVGAATGLRIGQEHFTPSVIGQDYQVRAPQIGGFFRAERGVVHAAEECDHAGAARAEFADRAQEPASLVGVNHAARVNFLEGAGAGPGDSVERAGGQDLPLDHRVFHDVVQHRALTVGGICGGQLPVLLLADAVENGAGADGAGVRLGEFGHRDGCGFQPLDNGGDVVGRLGCPRVAGR